MFARPLFAEVERSTFILNKFWRRHVVQLAALSLVVVSLSILVITSTSHSYA
jgi:hypothetical protein